MSGSPRHPVVPFGATPSTAQRAWHTREQYGFIHFTVNTFTNKEWGYGDESPAIFDPRELDCDQWVAAAKAGGLRGLILTAKHHDGFCLWPTRTTLHNISASPFRDGKGDVVRELADACRRGGISLGLYCSPWDRNHPEYGREAYVGIYHQQWEELLTGYGELFELWLDGANGGDGFYGGANESRSIDASVYYRFPELIDMMRKHQPNAMIFSDVGPDIRWCGNESGFTGITSWSTVDAKADGFGVATDQPHFVVGTPTGDTWRPVEVDISARPGWFFHPTERVRSGDELFTIWKQSVGRGACLNLNLPPTTQGLIASEDIRELMELRHRIASFTATDLAQDARLAVEDGTDIGNPADPAAAYDALAALVDGDVESYWAASSTTPSIVVEFRHESRVIGLRIEEAIQFGQRVESFAIDVQMWRGWYEWYRGGTIGARTIVELNGAVAKRVRIRITGALAPPVLSVIRVYGGGQNLWALQG